MIDKNEYLICYMDVLGYGDLVKKVSMDYGLIEKISDSIDKELKFINKSQEVVKEKILNNEKYDSDFSPVFPSLSMISDSILVTLPLEIENLDLNIQGFLFYLSSLWLILPHSFGCLLRGHICKGQYFEKKIGVNNESTFIFSEALVQAEAQEKKADWSRITIDSNALKFIKEKEVEIKSFKDIDGLYAFDIYSYAVPEADEYRKKNLKHVVNIVNEQIKRNVDNSKILHKYHHFAEYHNRKIKEYGLDVNEFEIKIN